MAPRDRTTEGTQLASSGPSSVQEPDARGPLWLGVLAKTLLGPEFHKRKPAVGAGATVHTSPWCAGGTGHRGPAAHWCHSSDNGWLPVPAYSSADHSATKAGST